MIYFCPDFYLSEYTDLNDIYQKHRFSQINADKIK